MTLIECIENHKKLWMWLSEETLKQKRKVFKYEYFAKYDIKGVLHHCFACSYSDKFTRLSCNYCPFIKTGDCALPCCNGLYNEWDVLFSGDYKRRRPSQTNSKLPH